jgi:hypothetical protein
MFLDRGMAATTAETIVFDSNRILRLFKGKVYFLTSKYVPIKILTKNLSSLIIDLILRIYHYYVFSTHLKKNISNQLRVA